MLKQNNDSYAEHKAVEILVKIDDIKKIMPIAEGTRFFIEDILTSMDRKAVRDEKMKTFIQTDKRYYFSKLTFKQLTETLHNSDLITEVTRADLLDLT